MFSAPVQFRGSWLELYRNHIQANLPSVDAVGKFHSWMIQYSEDSNSVFPVRSVSGTERRKVYVTSDGTSIAPADNSPAWVVHALLMAQRLSSYGDFRETMMTMPTHMFDIPRSVGPAPTANHYGWYVAHVYPAKNRDIDFTYWPRSEVKRRFFLTLHPCNVFLVPGVRNRRHGEDSRVIAFIAEQYASRYGAIYDEFLRIVGAIPLVADPVFGSKAVQPVDLPAKIARVLPQNPQVEETVQARYSATRLTFKRDVIEQLALHQAFEIETPMGVFRFTKQEFQVVFRNVAESESYRNRGYYNYRELPQRALRFKVRD